MRGDLRSHSLKQMSQALKASIHYFYCVIRIVLSDEGACLADGYDIKLSKPEKGKRAVRGGSTKATSSSSNTGNFVLPFEVWEKNAKRKEVYMRQMDNEQGRFASQNLEETVNLFTLIGVNLVGDAYLEILAGHIIKGIVTQVCVPAMVAQLDWRVL